MIYYTEDSTLLITLAGKDDPEQLFTIRMNSAYYQGYITYLPVSGTYQDASDERRFDPDGISIVTKPTNMDFPYLHCTLQSTATDQRFLVNTAGIGLVALEDVDKVVESYQIAKETLLQIIRILDEYFPGVVDHEELKGNIVE